MVGMKRVVPCVNAGTDGTTITFGTKPGSRRAGLQCGAMPPHYA
ncbi:hypothetical protein SXCC_03392 [Gluconacetobacter sp. SXCC-1]|nr:hypothetical protein SXCC_03392 [Gluconacetobacter sp. SXCC-1]